MTILNNISYDEIEVFFLSPSIEEDLKHWVNTYKTAYFITGVRIDNKLAGVAIFFPPAYGIFHITSYYVLPEYRGRSVVGALKNNIVNFARLNRYSFIITVIDNNNEAGIRVHQKYGYIKGLHIGNTTYLYFPVNKKGRIICKLSPVFFLALHGMDQIIRVLRKFVHIKIN